MYRIANRGIARSGALEALASAPPPSERTNAVRIPTPIDDPTLTMWDNVVLDVLGKYIAAPPTLPVPVTRTKGSTVADLVKGDMWDVPFCEAVMRYYSLNAQPGRYNKSKRITSTFLHHFCQIFIELNAKVAHNPLSAQRQREVRRRAQPLCDALYMYPDEYSRPQIGFGAVNAFLAGTASIGIGWSRGISYILFQALSAYAGFPPSWLLRILPTSKLDQTDFDAKLNGGDGARLGDFVLSYKRRTLKDAPEIHGWFQPRGAYGPLLRFSPATTLGLSPAALLVIYAAHVGVFGWKGLERVFTGLEGNIEIPKKL
jgi:hypothetical protein